MANGDNYRITISEERLNLALATLRLEFNRDLTASEERTRTRLEEVKTSIAGNPQMFAGMKATLADLSDDVDYLSKRDWWGSGISILLATFFSWLMSGGQK